VQPSALCEAPTPSQSSSDSDAAAVSFARSCSEILVDEICSDLMSTVAGRRGVLKSRVSRLCVVVEPSCVTRSGEDLRISCAESVASSSDTPIPCNVGSSSSCRSYWKILEAAFARPTRPCGQERRSLGDYFVSMSLNRFLFVKIHCQGADAR